MLLCIGRLDSLTVQPPQKRSSPPLRAAIGVQPTTDILALVLRVKECKLRFESLVNEAAVGIDGVRVNLRSSTKQLGRIMEKALLKGPCSHERSRVDLEAPLDVSTIFDVFGGMLVCDGFESMVAVLDRLGSLIREASVVLRRSFGSGFGSGFGAVLVRIWRRIGSGFDGVLVLVLVWFWWGFGGKSALVLVRIWWEYDAVLAEKWIWSWWG
jgi:hypothetical protein